MSTLSLEQWKAISPLLDEALDKSETERAAWLEDLRSQDPAVAEQLETLLKEHRALSDDHFLESQLVQPPVKLGLAGQAFGVYTLISQIGHGGMGAVWLAERNDKRFERRFAVKFLNLSLVGTAAEERFRREGSILGRLTHPNIAQLVDAGITPTGQPYLVLEHIEGDHIDRYCDQHHLTVEARLKLFLDVLTAVSHAHTNLIVHRDLKPSNVLVSNEGQVKLLDFGIAKFLEDENSGEATLTLEAGRALTPEYAAPEQLKAEAVTTATDVYALGALLYVLLTGQHPTSESTQTPAELINAVIDKEPTRPSVAAHPRTQTDVTTTNAARRATTPDKLSRQLRGDLDTIVGKALKKDPTERYASGTAFADDLHRYLKNEPISARPDTKTYRAAKFIRRNRTVVALVSLAVIATIAGLVGTLLQARTARQQRDFAFRQLSLAARVNDLNELILSEAEPSGKPVTPSDLLKLEERVIQNEHYKDAATHVELLVSLGEQYTQIPDNANGQRVLQQAYDLSRNIKDSSARAKASCALSWTFQWAGDIAKAESLAQEGLHEIPAGPQFSPERAFCSLRSSEIASRNGNATAAIAGAEAAGRALKDLPVPAPEEELNILSNLAGDYGEAGRFREATATYERAAALMTEMGYDNTEKAVQLFNNWAYTMSVAGRPLDAEKAYRRALDISRTDQTEDSTPAIVLYNYASVLRDLGRNDDAAHYGNIAYAKARLAGNPSFLAQTLLQQTRIRRDQHDFPGAASALSETESLAQRVLPPGHYAFASITSEEAQLARAQGDLTKALQFANQAVGIDEAAIRSTGGEGAGVLPDLLVRRANIELAMRQLDQAMADANRALELWEKTTQAGTLSSTAGRAYLILGHALQSQGKTAEAHAAFQSAFEHLQSAVGPDYASTKEARQALNN